MTDNATMKIRRAHLQDLLREARYKFEPKYSRGRVKSSPMPKAVRRASRIVARWEKQARKAHEARARKIEKAAQKIETVIIFGHDAKALKMIEAFRRMKFE